MSLGQWLLFWASTCAVLLGTASSAWADDSDRGSEDAQDVSDPQTPGGGDGVYGRYLGDLSYRIGLGADVDVQAARVRPLVVAELNGYQTLGVYAAYREGLSNDVVDRALSMGVTFSPFFLFRFSRAYETGYPYWDMFVDSLGIGAGLHLTEPLAGSFAKSRGVEVSGLCGVPLLPRANGPWLRVRGVLESGRKAVDDDFQAMGGSIWLYLSWEGFFYGGLLHSRER